MFANTLSGLVHLYEYFAINETVKEKLKQNRGDDTSLILASNLEGSVGICTVTGNRIVKEIKCKTRVESASKSVRSISNLIGCIDTKIGKSLEKFADNIAMECDLQREGKIQAKFFDTWKEHQSIHVPEVYHFSEQSIVMLYYPQKTWVHFGNLENNLRKWTCFQLLAQFFFDSFEKNGLLHGDISKYNVLVHTGKTEIVVLDYGMSSVISTESKKGFDDMRQNSPNSFAQRLASKWWHKHVDRREFTDEWLAGLKQDFNLDVILSSVNIPENCIDDLIMFLRSVIALSCMAVEFAKF
jgi:hypothetical protein